MFFFIDGMHQARHRGLLTGTSSFRSRSTMPEGPSKRPREDSEVVVEETTDAEFVGEPPAPKQAAGDTGEIVVARLGQAPGTLSIAPAAHMPEDADTSGALRLSFDSEGCVSSCLIADGFCFTRMPRGAGRRGSPRAGELEEA